MFAPWFLRYSGKIGVQDALDSKHQYENFFCAHALNARIWTVKLTENDADLKQISPI